MAAWDDAKVSPAASDREDLSAVAGEGEHLPAVAGDDKEACRQVHLCEQDLLRYARMGEEAKYGADHRITRAIEKARASIVKKWKAKGPKTLSSPTPWSRSAGKTPQSAPANGPRQ